MYLVCGLACAWMALRARNASPRLVAIFRDFESPEHVPRTSARAHTCAVVYGRAFCLPRNRKHEKRPAAGRGKNGDVQKQTLLYIANEHFPQQPYSYHIHENNNSSTAHQFSWCIHRMKRSRTSPHSPGPQPELSLRHRGGKMRGI